MRTDTGVVAERVQAPRLAWRKAPPAPALGPGEVHLWRAGVLPAGAGSVDAAWLALSDSERHRALSHRDERRMRTFVAARGCLRAILGRYLGCEPADVAIETGTRGRPRVRSGALPGLDFSVSRVDGTAVIAVVSEGRVGVDAERVRAAEGDALPWRLIREGAPEGLLKGMTSGESAEAFCIAWTRLEAYAKAFTDGLAGLHAEPVADPRRLHVRSFEIDDGLVGSLAESGPVPRTLLAFDLQIPKAM